MKNRFFMMWKSCITFLIVVLFASFILSACGNNSTEPKADNSITVTDVDGNVYRTVKIGNQLWMAENLKVTHFRNGKEIPHVEDIMTWRSLSESAYCNPKDGEANVNKYGRLYNAYAVDDINNLAPAGWHVPNEAEWQTLIGFLGDSLVAGGKMKTTGTLEGGNGLWYSPNTSATNSSGFSALPGGYRYEDGSHSNMGARVAYRTSTKDDSSSVRIYWLIYDRSSVFGARDQNNDLGFSDDPRYGYPVRCVRDGIPDIDVQ